MTCEIGSETAGLSAAASGGAAARGAELGPPGAALFLRFGEVDATCQRHRARERDDSFHGNSPDQVTIAPAGPATSDACEPSPVTSTPIMLPRMPLP